AAFSGSHNCTGPSAALTASRLPSGENSRLSIGLRLAALTAPEAMVFDGFPEVSVITTEPLVKPRANRFPSGAQASALTSPSAFHSAIFSPDETRHTNTEPSRASPVASPLTPHTDT